MVGGAQITLVVYAVALLIGGILGYVEAKSVISLVAGSISAVLVFLASQQARNQPKTGLGLGALLALLLAVNFFMRYKKQWHFWPSGLFLVLSVVVALIVGAALLKKDA